MSRICSDDINNEYNERIQRINMQSKLIDLLKDKNIDGDMVIKILESFDMLKLDKTDKTDLNNVTIDNDKHDYITPIKGRTGGKIKIQQYDTNLKLLYTYTTIIEILRRYPTMSKTGILHACKTNTLYHNFRWYLLNKDDEIKEYDIPLTENKISSIPRIVAVLDKNKTNIIEVFNTQTEAMSFLNISRKQTITDLIKTGRLYKNTYYFMLYDNCNNELKNDFLSRKKLPDGRVSKGKKVQQIDVKTEDVIKTYNSIIDVIKDVCMSRESLKYACNNNEVYAGYLWRFVE